MTRPAFHLAFPVDDLAAARAFYGGTLGLSEGRSSSTWVDWDFHGHQIVTHLDADAAERATDPAGRPLGSVDGHLVPIPHFGLVLTVPAFHALAERLRAAGVTFVIEPYLRFPGQPAEQWTMFLHDPAGNALEFKAFRDETMIFA